MESTTQGFYITQAIASDQVIVPNDPDLPVQLTCDASPTGIVGVLSHIIDGHEHPTAFASPSLKAAEQNYSHLDREALAIIFTIDFFFFQYQFGHHFQLVTAGRIQLYAAFLSGFNYTIDFKKGIENSNVDCLFRAPIIISSYIVSVINNEVKQLCDATIKQISILTVTYQLLKEETKKDAILSMIMNFLQEENTSEPDYLIESGILFRGQRVVPASLQSAVLN
ncbi:hypothetical protein PR048_004576 [Dryococelus australis]|uniref:Reverse transcriptase/retrotransposon-derived protein RNase H-like domain-containing protein n=1 Tax=Dryococelus australis TaxID=614101 RepID=A0ABQ9I6L7_9NEOP|nr:hypothetical protein PR048_004576 [Dryococelus australis]